MWRDLDFLHTARHMIEAMRSARIVCSHIPQDCHTKWESSDWSGTRCLSKWSGDCFEVSDFPRMKDACKTLASTNTVKSDTRANKKSSMYENFIKINKSIYFCFHYIHLDQWSGNMLLYLDMSYLEWEACCRFVRTKVKPCQQFKSNSL